MSQYKILPNAHGKRRFVKTKAEKVSMNPFTAFERFSTSKLCDFANPRPRLGLCW